MKKIAKLMIAFSLIFSVYSNNGVYAQEDLNEEVVQQEEKDTQENSEETFFVEPEVENATTRIVAISDLGIYNEQDKYEYLTGEPVIVYITFTATGLGDPIENATLEVLIPKDFIDRADIQVGTVDLVSSYTITTEENHYRVTYQMNKIASGMRLDIPLTFTTKRYSTPNQEVIKLEAFLKDGEGNELISSASRDFTTKTNGSENKFDFFFKQMGSIQWLNAQSTSNWVVVGKPNPSNPTNSSDNLDDLSLIEFSPKLNLGNPAYVLGDRGYSEIKVVYTLPEEATFVSEENPGWVYDSTLRTATYVHNHIGADTPNALQTGDVVLKLKFPDVVSGTAMNFKCDLFLTPENMNEHESILTVSKEASVIARVATAPISLNADISGTYAVYDIESARSDELLFFYTIESAAKVFEHGADANLKDVSIESHQLHDFAEYTRLEFSDMPVFKPEGNSSVNIFVTHSDGSEEQIKTDFVIGDAVKTVDLPEGIVSVRVDFTEGTYIKPENKFRFYVIAKIKDPSVDILAEGEESRSYNFIYGKFSGTYEGYNTVNQTTSHRLRFREYSPRIYIDKKIIDEKPVYLAGDIIRFDNQIISVYMEKEARIEMNQYLEILPLGVNYVPGTSSILHTEGIELVDPLPQIEPTVVYNYKDTGRTALIWDLPPIILKGESYTGSISNFITLFYIRYSVQKTKYVSEGDITYRSNLMIDNLDELRVDQDLSSTAVGALGGFVDDELDLDDDESVTDQVLIREKTVTFAPPGELVSKQEVKGSLDSLYLLDPAYGTSEFGSQVDYKFTIDNNSKKDYQEVYTLNLLPKVGDFTTSSYDGEHKPRQSTMGATLAQAVVTPADWKVYYSTEDYGTDIKAYYANASNWSETVTDFSEVKAFKVELISGKTFSIGASAEFFVTYAIPGASEVDTTESYSIVNSLGFAASQNYDFIETNFSTTLVDSYAIEGTIFKDWDQNSIYDSLNDEIFEGYKVYLLDKDGNAVLDPEGNPIETLTDSEGRYAFNILNRGEYRVKLDENSGVWDLVLQDEFADSKFATDTVSDVFILDEDNRYEECNAAFTVDGFVIESIAGEGGSISPLGETEAQYGSDVTFTILPDEGYLISQLLVDGEEVEISDSYTFTNIDDHHTIEVIFVKKQYTVTIRSNELGAVVANDGRSRTSRAIDPKSLDLDIDRVVEQGDTLRVNINPDEGYHVIEVYINGVQADDEFVSKLNSTGFYEIQNISNNIDATVIFGASTHGAIHTVNFLDCNGELIGQAWPADGMNAQGPSGYDYNNSELTNITYSKDVRPINCSGGFVIPNTGR